MVSYKEQIKNNNISAYAKQPAPQPAPAKNYPIAKGKLDFTLFENKKSNGQIYFNLVIGDSKRNIQIPLWLYEREPTDEGELNNC